MSLDPLEHSYPSGFSTVRNGKTIYICHFCGEEFLAYRTYAIHHDTHLASCHKGKEGSTMPPESKDHERTIRIPLRELLRLLNDAGLIVPWVDVDPSAHEIRNGTVRTPIDVNYDPAMRTLHIRWSEFTPSTASPPSQAQGEDPKAKPVKEDPDARHT